MKSQLLLSYLNEVLGVDQVLLKEELASSVSGTFEKLLRPYLILLDSKENLNVQAELLSKILEALKWPSSQFHILPLTKENLDFLEITYFPETLTQSPSSESLKSLRIFVFGALSLPAFIPKVLSPDQILCLPGLSEMIQNPQLKKEAWNRLKPFVTL